MPRSRFLGSERRGLGGDRRLRRLIEDLESVGGFRTDDRRPSYRKPSAFHSHRQRIVSERLTTWRLSIMLDSTTGTPDHAIRRSITLDTTAGHFPPDGGRPFAG